MSITAQERVSLGYSDVPFYVLSVSFSIQGELHCITRPGMSDDLF